MEALGGSLAQGPLVGLFNIVDPTFSKTIDKIIDDSLKQFRKDKKFYREQYDKKLMSRADYDFEVGAISGFDVSNNVVPPIIGWLKNKKRADEFVRIVYQYATARSQESSKFVIAK